MAKEKQNWLDPSFLTEVISGTVLILWTVYTGLTSLNVYVSIAVGLVIYVVFMFSLLYGKRSSDKLKLETLKAQLAKEEKTDGTKIFWDSNKGDITESEKRGIDRNARFSTCHAIISLFEQSAKDETLPQQEREFYAKAVKRLKDVEHASTFS